MIDKVFETLVNAGALGAVLAWALWIIGKKLDTLSCEIRTLHEKVAILIERAARTLAPLALLALSLAVLAGCAAASRGAADGIGAAAVDAPLRVLPPAAGTGMLDYAAYTGAALAAYVVGSLGKGWIRMYPKGKDGGA